MGRHSASYIAAQQRPAVRRTAADATRIVGSLALALGIGAAMSGGTAIANAQGRAADGAGGPGTQSSPDSPTGDDRADAPAAVASPATRSPGARVRRPGLITGPRMHLGDSDSTSIRARRATGGGQDSLPDLV